MPRFVTCGPNEAIIVSGCCHSNPLMVPGGRVFVWPLFHKIQRISLNTMTLTVESPKVYSEGGVQVNVKGVAQVKIQGKDLAGLRAAIEMFLDKTEEEIMDIAKATLEGHQRSIIASMKIENIYKDRKKFSKDVQQSAQTDLIDMGLTLISYTVQDISDDDGYLAALGEEKTIAVKTDARKEMAQTKKQSETERIQSEQTRLEGEANNKQAIAQIQRDFEYMIAEHECFTNSKKAESDLAASLESARTKQKIAEEQNCIQLMETEQECLLLDKKLEQKRLELKALVEGQADAEYERAMILAEAYKKKSEIETLAEASAIERRSKARAEVLKTTAAIEARQMKDMAEAYSQYPEAGKADMILSTLPRLVAEVAAPITNCNKMTVVSQNKDIGLRKVTGEVFSIVDQICNNCFTTVGHLSAADNNNPSNPDNGDKKGPRSPDTAIKKAPTSFLPYR